MKPKRKNNDNKYHLTTYYISRPVQNYLHDLNSSMLKERF